MADDLYPSESPKQASEVDRDATIWRSLSNPRVLLSSLLAVVLFYSIIWAYVDRPRLLVGFGGIADTIPVAQTDCDGVEVRSVQFRGELEKRLVSTAFMQALHAKDIRQPRLLREDTSVVVSHLPAPSLDANPMAAELSTGIVNAYQSQALVIMIGFCDRSDVSLMYFYPRSYSVHRPTNAWIRWLQVKLPGMPDESRLAMEADTANKAAKDDISELVASTVQDCVSACRH